MRIGHDLKVETVIRAMERSIGPTHDGTSMKFRLTAVHARIQAIKLYQVTVFFLNLSPFCLPFPRISH